MENNSKKMTAAQEMEQVSRQIELLQQRVLALRKDTREDNLKKVKELCKLHGFTATLLKGSIVTRGKALE